MNLLAGKASGGIHFNPYNSNGAILVPTTSVVSEGAPKPHAYVT
jgi:hypothetical protein